MGKSSYKKFMQKERAKVKLKGANKKLPKGLNVTDTNFKVKKIVIRDQIKQHGPEELLSKRKLNLKELLSRLRHHNSNMVRDALSGIKELLIQNSELLIYSEAPTLISEVSKLTVGEFFEVRVDANKLLTEILSKITINALTPLFPTLFSHLVCGLTHIEPGVRRDSLNLLDSLITFAPNLCAKEFSIILPICLDLMSEATSDSRMLSLHLESKTTAGKWRAKVLSRIRMLLEALSKLYEGSSPAESPMACKEKTLFGNNDSKLYASLFAPEPFIAFDFNLSLFNAIDKTKDYTSFSIKEFAEMLVPLLLDSFTEVVPDEDTTQSGNADYIVTLDVAALLQSIVQILLHLRNILIQMDDTKNQVTVLNKYSDAITNRLVRNKFPYACRPENTSSRKRKESNMVIVALKATNLEATCFDVNLTLAKLVILLTDDTHWKPIINYIKNCLRSHHKLNEKDCEILSSCLFEITKKSSIPEVISLLSSAAKLCTGSPAVLSGHLFHYLTQVALNHEMAHFHRDTMFEGWLESLPELLLSKSVTLKLIETISQVAIRRFRSFSQALDGCIEAILDNIPNIQATEIEKGNAAILLVNLLYWVDDWDDKLLDGIARGIENSYWDPVITKHIQQVVMLKSELSQDPQFERMLLSNEWWSKQLFTERNKT